MSIDQHVLIAHNTLERWCRDIEAVANGNPLSALGMGVNLMGAPVSRNSDEHWDRDELELACEELFDGLPVLAVEAAILREVGP